jgi:hypothetical protein
VANGDEELDPTKVQQVAQDTAEKRSIMMQTYLGADPDSSEAIEFLCLVEGDEVTHYEVLAAMSEKHNGKIKNTRKLSTTINSILREEKSDHREPDKLGVPRHRQNHFLIWLILLCCLLEYHCFLLLS